VHLEPDGPAPAERGHADDGRLHVGRLRLITRRTGLAVVALALTAIVLPTVRAGVPGALDGWFLSFAVEMSHGRVPYRDFYMWCPPLHALEHLVLLSLFGPRVLPGHVVGGVFRVGLGLVLYAWMSRRSHVAIAAVASVASVAVLATDPADVVFYYQQQGVFYAVVAGYLLSLALDSNDRPRAARWLAMAAGLSGALALLTKQTVGGATCVALLLTWLLAARVKPGPRRGLTAPLLLGMALPVAALGAWLAKESALGAFVRAMALGSSSKGPLLAILTRIVTVEGEGHEYVAASVVAVTLLLLLALNGDLRSRVRARFGDLAWLAASGTVLTLGVAGVAVLLGNRPWMPRLPQLAALQLGTLGSLLALGLLARRAMREGLTLDTMQGLHAALLACATAYAMSLSWGAFEPMACPSLAVAACAATSAGRTGDRSTRWAVGIACAVAAAFAVQMRIEVPFGWVGWTDPPLTQDTATSRLPALAGMRLSPETDAFYDRVTDDIARESNPGDPIFVFPHMPIFHLLADRPPATRVMVTFLDVAPDDVAAAVAQQLLAAPPQVMVVMAIRTEKLFDLERAFRGGRPSGQRDIIRAINVLMPSYRLADTLHMPGSNEQVYVFARTTRPAK
jgi:hypothetical protein